MSKCRKNALQELLEKYFEAFLIVSAQRSQNTIKSYKYAFPHGRTRSHLRKLLTVHTENGMNNGSQKSQQFPSRQITKEECRIFSSK